MSSGRESASLPAWKGVTTSDRVDRDAHCDRLLATIAVSSAPTLGFVPITASGARVRRVAAMWRAFARRRHSTCRAASTLRARAELASEVRLDDVTSRAARRQRGKLL